MKINKSDFKDSMAFLSIAIVFFLITLDIAFPVVMFIMKGVFYILGLLMFILGVSTMYRSIFGKKNNDIIQ